jgi:hypothetical protein
VKKQPKGAVARATAVAEEVGNAVRRRQRERAPRVVVYGRAGFPQLLHPGAKGYDESIEIAERMVALVGEEGATDGALRGRAARRSERAKK